MFRNSRALTLAVFTGWVGAIVFFIMGVTETIRAGDYLSRAASATAAMPERAMPIAAATGPAMFVLHGFIFTVCLGALFYLLALGSRMYSVHPTSTVTGLAFLSVPITLMAIHEAWLAFGLSTIQGGALASAFITTALAFFGFWGFVSLGYAFGNQRRTLGLQGWCWVSALGLLWSAIVLAAGYGKILAGANFSRGMIILGELGLWVLPTITMAIGASWLAAQNRAAMIRPVTTTEARAA